MVRRHRSVRHIRGGTTNRDLVPVGCRALVGVMGRQVLGVRTGEGRGTAVEVGAVTTSATAYGSGVRPVSNESVDLCVAACVQHIACGGDSPGL
jgi:hypothetical protein